MPMTVSRDRDLREISGLLRRFPVVAIVGARQIGKTTLARQIAARWRGPTHHFDLEVEADLARVADPMLALPRLRGLVVLDEIQRRPELFPALRALADRPRGGARFLVLGSASPHLLRQSSESLAGRIAYHELGGFSLDEVGAGGIEELWVRGGFPRSFLAASDATSAEWRRQFVTMFLERDLPQLGITIPSATLRRFWSMLAHYHGQTWNGSEIASSFGVGDTTVRRYLDLLAGTYVVRVLPSWSENLGKRQVKAPKVYIADTGLLHTLLGIETLADLEGHPKAGFSWERFAMDTVIRSVGARSEECYFWRTHAGAELDLLIVRGRRRLGFEFKRTTAPEMTPSMRIALEDLSLESLTVVHAGDHTFPLASRVLAVGLARVGGELACLASRPKRGAAPSRRPRN